MKEFILSNQEIKSLQTLTAWRCRGKTHLKTKSLMCSGRKDGSDYDKSFEGHYMGIAGEFVVARYLNGYFDVMPRPKGDKHSADVVSGVDGKLRVSVKTTKYSPPILKLNSLDEIKDATHIALCHFNEPNVTIHWIKSKNNFLKNMYKKDFGYGERLCLGVT
jgi:hypothetical protein